MNIYEKWLKAKENLDKAKAEELGLRLELVYEGPKKFAEKDIIYDAKVTQKTNYRIVEEQLNNLELNSKERDCIKYKPVLKMKEYKELPDNSMLHKAIIATPGTPTVKVKKESIK